MGFTAWKILQMLCKTQPLLHTPVAIFRSSARYSCLPLGCGLTLSWSTKGSSVTCWLVCLDLGTDSKNKSPYPIILSLCSLLFDSKVLEPWQGMLTAVLNRTQRWQLWKGYFFFPLGRSICNFTSCSSGGFSPWAAATFDVTRNPSRQLTLQCFVIA